MSRAFIIFLLFFRQLIAGWLHDLHEDRNCDRYCDRYGNPRDNVSLVIARSSELASNRRITVTQSSLRDHARLNFLPRDAHRTQDARKRMHSIDPNDLPYRD